MTTPLGSGDQVMNQERVYECHSLIGVDCEEDTSDHEPSLGALENHPLPRGRDIVILWASARAETGIRSMYIADPAMIEKTSKWPRAR
jgi:hypothetical protein